MPEQRGPGLSCPEVLACLGDYLDHQLPTDLEARVEAHLADCERCERFGAGVGKMLIATHDLGPAATVDDALREAILAGAYSPDGVSNGS